MRFVTVLQSTLVIHGPRNRETTRKEVNIEGLVLAGSDFLTNVTLLTSEGYQYLYSYYVWEVIFDKIYDTCFDKIYDTCLTVIAGRQSASSKERQTTPQS